MYIKLDTCLIINNFVCTFFQTYNIYSANAVQIGNQNLAQTGEQGTPESSDDEAIVDGREQKRTSRRSQNTDSNRMKLGKDRY